MIAKNYDKVPFTALQDFILIEPMAQRETKGGIALPEGVNEGDAQRGRIIKVGPGRVTEEGKLIRPDVQPGDIVYLYFAYGQPVGIVLEGVKYVIARSRDIVALAE